MADPTPPGGSGPGGGSASGSTLRSLKFKPKKVDRRSEQERSVAAQQIEAEQQKQARAAAQAQPPPAPVPSWQRRERERERGGGHRHAASTRPSASSASASASTSVFASASASKPESAARGAARGRASPSLPSSSVIAGVEPREVASGSKDGDGGEIAATSTAAAAQQRGKKATAKSTPSKQTKVKTEKTEEGEKPFVVYDNESISDNTDADADQSKHYITARDVAQLELLSDSDVEDAGDHGPALRPISLTRHEHVDRVKNLNTEATSAASARLRQRQHDQQPPQAAEEDEDDIVTIASTARRSKRASRGIVKPDPDGDVEMQDASSSFVEGTATAEETEESSTRLALHETDEDRAEGDRLRADRAMLLEELGDTAHPSQRDRHIYMFQFPPLLPNLIPGPDPGSSTAPAGSATAAATPGPSMASTTTSANPTTPSSRRKGKQKATSASSAAAPIATEAPTTAAATATTTANPDPLAGTATEATALHAAEKPTLAGYVGSLRVYSDGSAALSWGGLEHEVRRGVRGELLQQVLVAGGLPDADGEQQEEKEKEKQKREEGADPSGLRAGENGTESPPVVAASRPTSMSAPPDPYTATATPAIEPTVEPTATSVGQVHAAYIVTPGWAQLLEKAG